MSKKDILSELAYDGLVTEPGERDRRERIATACLAGIASHPEFPGAYAHYADEAVQYADALIARLDKEAKP